MKKTTRMLAVAGVCLALVAALALAGCSSAEPSGDEAQEAQSTQEAQGPAAESQDAEGDAAQDSAQAADGQEAQPQEEQAATAKYAVTIDDAYVGSDYEGNPAIVVTYSWVNNSDEATSALVSLDEKAFQNGVQLEDAFFLDDVDTSGWDSEVKPGSGTTFQRGYVLADTSDVTIEVEDPWDWESDGLLAEATFSVS